MFVVIIILQVVYCTYVLQVGFFKSLKKHITTKNHPELEEGEL